MTCEIIQTGSKGNAVLLDGSLLIDCGVPFAKLKACAKDLKLVLLTHKHGDHFNRATVRKLSDERPTLRWACCEWMVPLLVDCGVDKCRIDVVRPGALYIYPKLRLSPVELVHDVPNCGWLIDINGYKVFYATDTGTLDGVKAKDYDLYLLEANHTTEEIEARAKEKMERGEFSYEVRAAANHLSQEQAMNWLADNAGPCSKYIFLHQHDKG